MEWSRALGLTKNADEDDLEEGDTGWEKMDRAMEGSQQTRSEIAGWGRGRSKVLFVLRD